MVRHYNEDGYIKTTGTSSISGLESINYVVKIFPEISKFLTVPQKEYLRSEIYNCLLISFKAQIIYTSVTKEQAKPLFDPLVNVMREDLKSDTYNFLDLDFLKLHADLKAIEDPNYSPFKTVSHHNFE